jgi:hypothetical protein
MARIDRRADYIAVSRPATLDRINDIQAATDEGRKYLNRAWRANRPEGEPDWGTYLHWMGQTLAVFEDIRRVGNDWAGTVTSAPAIDPNQIQIWEQAAAAA